MRLPTFTVRGLMLLILLTCISLHLSASAWRASRYGTPHLHSAILANGGNPGKATLVRKEPFFPAFLHQVTGMGAGCFLGGEAKLEMCELSYPEIRVPSGPNFFVPEFTQEQLRLVEQITREQQARSSGQARPLPDSSIRVLFATAGIRLPSAVLTRLLPSTLLERHRSP